MITVDIVSPPQATALANRVATALTQAGFLCQLPSSLATDESSSLMVAITEPLDPVVCYHIGRRVGRGTPILLVVPTAAHLLPEFSPLPIVTMGVAHLEQEIVTAARRLLRVHAEEAPRLTSGELLCWIAEDENRISQLTSSQLVDLVGLLFEQSGLQASRSALGEEADLIVDKPEWGLRALVECKAPVASSPIGLATVREIHDSCLRKDATVAFLISTSHFTKAAEDWASRCAPSVHLLSRTWLEMAIRGYAGGSSTRLDSLLPNDMVSKPKRAGITAQRTSQRSVVVWGSGVSYWHSKAEGQGRRPSTERRDVDCIVWDSSQIASETDVAHKLLSLEGWWASEESTPIVVDTSKATQVAHLAGALQQAGRVFVIAGDHGVVPTSSLRFWHRLAHTWPGGDLRLFVLGRESPTDRWRLPQCFFGASFIDPGPDVIKSLADMLRKEDPPPISDKGDEPRDGSK